MPKQFHRSAKFDSAKIDTDKRTVELAFSSEEPVERWGENEVLGHREGEYDFSRLNNSHPLLLGHDSSEQIGVVESAKVDADKKGRAIVRFSSNPRAQEIFQDVIDGIRKHVSVGYSRDSILSSEKSENGMVTTRYKWSPHEISIVPIPADTTVGIGRAAGETDPAVDSLQKLNAEDIVKNLTDDQKKSMKRILFDKTATDGGGTVTVEAEFKRGQGEGATTERNRINEIEAFADAIRPDYLRKSKEIDELKREHMIGGKSAVDFQRALFGKLPAWRSENPITMATMGFSERDQKSYSFSRALQRAVEKNIAAAIPDGLEGEVHQELAKRCKSDCTPSGFLVPLDGSIDSRGAGIRAQINRKDRLKMRAANDLQSGIFAQGGASVATEIYLPVIELLRNKMVTERLGVKTISGLDGNIAWPRQVAKANPYFVPETFGLNPTNPLLDQILASPKRIGVTGAVGKQLILQSSIDAMNWLQDDQLLSLAVEMDRVTLLGAGANSEPLGIFNTPGIGSVNFGGAVTYQKVVNFKTQLALANALAEGMAFVTTPGVEEKWRTTPKVGTTFPIFIWEDGSWGDDTADGRVVGLRATATNQLTNDRVAFGNFMDAAKLMWGGLDVLVNPYTRSKEAMVEITTNAFMDVLVRHQGSFVFSADAGDQ